MGGWCGKGGVLEYGQGRGLGQGIGPVELPRVQMTTQAPRSSSCGARCRPRYT